MTVEGSLATVARTAASVRGETWVDAASVASGVSEVLTSEWIFADPPQQGIEAIMRMDMLDSGQQVAAQTGGIVATISTIAIANNPKRLTAGTPLL